MKTVQRLKIQDKRHKFRIPEDFWKLRRHSVQTLPKPGSVEVQSWGIDANGQAVCAGVHHCPCLSARWAWHIYHNWQRWRRWYDGLPWNRLEDYPAKHSPAVIFWGIHPIGNPKQVVWIKVQPNP